MGDFPSRGCRAFIQFYRQQSTITTSWTVFCVRGSRANNDDALCPGLYVIIMGWLNLPSPSLIHSFVLSSHFCCEKKNVPFVYYDCIHISHDTLCSTWYTCMLWKHLKGNNVLLFHGYTFILMKLNVLRGFFFSFLSISNGFRRFDFPSIFLLCVSEYQSANGVYSKFTQIKTWISISVV